jgi:hypothetical protein
MFRPFLRQISPRVPPRISPLVLSRTAKRSIMNAQELKLFLADSPPSTVNLVIKKHFEALSEQQKRYAHYISRYDLLVFHAINSL